MSASRSHSAEDRVAAAWIRKMAQGEVEGLDALYAMYHRQLLSLSRAILTNEPDAEEVLQDTFIRAFREARRYDPESGRPFTWLATIGKRLAIDRLRRRRARPDFAADSREQAGADPDKESGDEDERVRQQLEFNWIRESLGSLPAEQGQAIELAFLQGYTHAEIAEKLGKPLGTVKSDIHRGLIHLRKVYLHGND